MYIKSVEKVWSSCFKQKHMIGKYKGKSIHITTNYLDGKPSFKTISVLDKDTSRECGKTPILGKFKAVYDTIVKRNKR